MFLLLTGVLSASAAAVATALLGARGARRELAALRAELAAHAAAEAAARTAALRADRADRAAAAVPSARVAADAEAIRGAVAQALADERERELAEARAFWAAQEAREAADAAGAPDPVGPLVADAPQGPYLPRQADLAGLAPEDAERAQNPGTGPGGFRHPSDPDFTVHTPVVAGPEQTAARLAELAESAVPLTDVRPGPLGTLDVYVFADGTTLCMTPGHRETALRLSDALDRGEAPVLLGGSAIAGAYALTFTYGGGEEGGEESVYILADRVVASI
jgi:hypothetical protein